MSQLFHSTVSGQLLRPTHVEVDLHQLATNFNLIRQAVSSSLVMPILKANAYGHGLIKVAHCLQLQGADYFGLAYLEEGLLLRQAGISTPILILGGIIGEQIPMFIEHNLTITASSVDKLKAIEACAKSMNKKACVHLKIDTGMERIGVHSYSARELFEVALTCSHTEIEGIFSHFATADEQDLSFAQSQLERFKVAYETASEMGLKGLLRHISNSGAIVQMPEAHLDMVRPGILLYGVYPAPHLPRSIEVRMVMRWVSRIVYFKVIPPQTGVSYGLTWKSATQTRILTVPVGYGDGYHRRMSSKARVLIRGERFRVVGTICMDQLMVELGDKEAFNGEEVVLMGTQASGEIHVEDLAEWADTIPYEILTSINTRVPRIFINQDQ